MTIGLLVAGARGVSGAPMLLAALCLACSSCDPDETACESPPEALLHEPPRLPPGPDSSVVPELLGSCGGSDARYEVEVIDPIAYGDQHPRQRMSAHLPVGVERAPAIVFVHGGSWWYGSRNDLADRARYFAERGIAAFSIEYFLADDETPSFPQNVKDVVCAARFIKANADEYGVDSRAMAAYGASAGGHLAAMLGVLEGDEPILDGACGDPEVSPKVRTVMNYFGYVDLEAAAEVDPEDGRVTRMLGVTWHEHPDTWRAASPASYLDPGDAVFLTGHGTDDTVVRPSVAAAFHERLWQAGVPGVIVEVPDGLHGFHGHPELDEAVRCAFEPLVERLLGVTA